MSYAEAKQIADLRQELRACWDRRDLTGAAVALSRLTGCAIGNSELTAEVKRWTFRLHAAP